IVAITTTVSPITRAGRSFSLSSMHLPRNALFCQFGGKRVCNRFVKMAGYGTVPYPTLQFKGVVRQFSPALRSVFCPGDCTMLVRDVLHTKGNRVISIDSAATVHEAVAKLVQN